jgi:hypothetical protein
MGRRAATFWHATASVAAGVLYFFFVLPRWPELMGDTSHALGTAARIVAGALIALAALPVVFTLLQSRKPEFGTPALALTLRTWSVVAHVVAGVLIVGTAISEIWLNLDSVGQWLFGIYGAAAAVAVLGIFAFHLSYVAERPPPAPKPLRPKKEKKQRRGRKKDDEADDSTDAEDAESGDEAEVTDDADDAEPDETHEVESATVDAESTAEEAPAVEDVEDIADTVADDSASGLRNRRPTGKGSHRRRRSRRGVAVEE